MQVFETVYQENVYGIYQYIYSHVSSREDAEDLTAQTFLKALRSLDGERSPLSVRKWLFQIARTTLADFWRVRSRLPLCSLNELVEAGWGGPSDQDEDASTGESLAHERVQQILSTLSPTYREVLTSRFLLNLSIKETAARLSLTEANVKIIQFRALKRAAELDPLARRDWLVQKVEEY